MAKKTSIFILGIVLVSLFVTINAFNQDDKTDIGKTAEIGNIQDSTTPDEILETKYNVHYRLADYGKVHDYSTDGSPTINAAGDYIDISILRPVSGGSYRTFILKNGSIFLFNITNINDGLGYYESRLYKGLNISRPYHWNLDMTNFELQKAITTPTNLLLFGKNTSTYEISVHELAFNGSTFNYVTSLTLPNPVLFSSINDMDIYSISYLVPYTYIGGKFRDGSTNVPFGYMLNAGFTIVQDFTNITTSTTDCLAFDDAILSLQEIQILSLTHCILSNKHVITIDVNNKINYSAAISPIPLSMVPSYFRVSRMFYWYEIVDLVPTYNEAFSWCYITLATEFISYRFTVMSNTPALPYRYFYTLENDPNISFLSQQLESDMTVRSMTDFSDGMFIFGEDRRFTVWQTWFVSTGSISGIFFDVYIPYKIIIYDDVVANIDSFEVWFGDSRSLYHAYFNSDDIKVLSVGNSTVNKIVSQRCDVSHDQGSTDFQYIISGYVERNSSEICEVGVIPLYAQPFGNLLVPIPTMLSISSEFAFKNMGNGGIILRTSGNFQGTGSNMIDFQVRFDADYCPLILEILGLKYVNINIYYLVWEKYNNGTYTQKLLRNSFTAKSALLTYSFTLETAITIQDSHMLDELHVFSNGIEYSAYNLVFTEPNCTVLVTDKITNVTLFNSARLFSDPLNLPIKAKYEFVIKYFSNFDRLGFDFSLVSTFINGTEVSTESVRILSPDAEIVVKDFSGAVIRNVTVNKYISGTYVIIGLDIVQVIFNNKYNFTINLYLERGRTSVFYQLPSGTALVLRLALGEYRYIVTYVNGTEIFDRTLSLNASFGVSIGSTLITFPEPSPLIGGLSLASVIALLVIVGMIVIIMVSLAYLVQKIRNPKTSTNKNKPKSGYINFPRK